LLFNSLSIYINIGLNWISVLESILSVSVVFIASAGLGYYNLKRTKIVERIKQI
jgi:hypothetical protein